MSRRLVLLGSTEGPWCIIRGMRKPKLVVTGLPLGGKIMVELCWHDRVSSVMVTVYSTGEFDLVSLTPEAVPPDSIRVSAQPAAKNLICFVKAA